MTKLQKKITELSNEDLVDRFDHVCVTMTKEINSVRGQTKKTANEWQLVRGELLRRLQTT